MLVSAVWSVTNVLWSMSSEKAAITLWLRATPVAALVGDTSMTVGGVASAVVADCASAVCSSYEASKTSAPKAPARAKATARAVFSNLEVEFNLFSFLLSNPVSPS